jgi:hypothetical protein
MTSAFDAYMGPGDVPEFKQSCVLYWDILGVRNFSRAPDALSLLVALDAALKLLTGAQDEHDGGIDGEDVRL